MSSHEKALARAGALSAAQIAASHRSCEELRQHILTSRRALDRSLELLSSTTAYARKSSEA